MYQILATKPLNQQVTKEVKEDRLDLIIWRKDILANADFVSKLKSGKQMIEMTNEMRNTLF